MYIDTFFNIEKILLMSTYKITGDSDRVILRLIEAYKKN